MFFIFISWLGNSTFLLKTSLGKRLLIDPINKFHTCNIQDYNTNIITLSSKTFKCNCISNINPEISVLSDTGIFNTDLGTIYSFASFNDNLSGLKRGANNIFLYEFDNLKICHLGYLGHILDDSIISKIKNCDILFLPVGGNITLDGKTAFKLFKKIMPKITIPMNYKFNTQSFLFDSPQEFLMLAKNVTKIKEIDLSITKEILDKENSNKIILLTPLKSNTI